MNLKHKNRFSAKAALILALTMLLSIFAAITACKGETSISNGDFETVASDHIPKGWSFYSYLNDTSKSVATVVKDDARGNVVKISSVESDDSHLKQAVTVKPNSVYHLSCYIKTENVEEGAGANISSEEGFALSDGVFGTTDWTLVEVYGKTGAAQTKLEVSCRLGNYGATSRGTAYFDDFRLEKVASAPAGFETKDFSVSSGSTSSKTEEAVNNRADSEIEQYTARMKMIFIMACVYILVPLIIFCLLHFEHVSDKKKGEKAIKTPAQNAPSFFDTTPKLPEKTDTKLHYTKLDWIFVCALTTIYALLAVTNLGSTSFPQTEWKGKAGESVTFSFGGTVSIAEIWQNGGITGGSNGSTTYTLIGENDQTVSAKQQYGVMYRWDKIYTSDPITTSYLTLNITGGEVWLNELAFIGTDGKPLPVTVSNSSAAALVDEQDKIPEYPNYMYGMYFDELYHARTAYEHKHNLKVYEITHPPLGKLIISVGISVFGMTPFGWRIMGALFGVLMVPLMYAFGKRMFKRPGLALLAAALMAFDFMHYTQTRISTIDVYGVFFNLCMTYYMYKFIKMDLGDSLKSTLLPLSLSGIFFGIGCASKWICIYTGAALAVMFFAKIIVTVIKANRINRMKLSKEEQNSSAAINAKHITSRTIKTVLWCIPFFIVIPLAIYIASYYPYYTAEWKPNAENTKIARLVAAGESVDESSAALTTGEKVKAYINGVIGNQEYMYKYHSGLESVHSYQSSWYEWPLSNRPMWFYAGYYHPDATRYGTISSFGNPAVWWLCFVGTVFMLLMTLRGRFKVNTEIFFILCCLASSMLPWMLISRSVFIYHYFATVPLIILSSVYVVKHYEDKFYYIPLEKGEASAKRKRIVHAKYVWIAAAVILFAVFYPVITGTPVSKNYISALQWLPTWTFMGYWPVIWPK